MNIKTILEKEAETSYKDFTSTLIPNINNVLGIRLPVLRKIAKEIYKTQDYESFLKNINTTYMEEVMLQGMIIGMLKKPPEKILELIEAFIPKIDNWAVCDCFCCDLKFTKKNKELVWNFIQPYFLSDKEYDLRFCYVMLLNYFIEDEYIDRVIKLIDNFNDDRYYSKMAVAWLVSICFVKQRDKTLNYMKKSKLEKWTYNKSIQKICESFRVDKQDKQLLKSMKK